MSNPPLEQRCIDSVFDKWSEPLDIEFNLRLYGLHQAIINLEKANPDTNLFTTMKEWLNLMSSLHTRIVKLQLSKIDDLEKEMKLKIEVLEKAIKGLETIYYVEE